MLGSIFRNDAERLASRLVRSAAAATVRLVWAEEGLVIRDKKRRHSGLDNLRLIFDTKSVLRTVNRRLRLAEERNT